jgi:integrase
VARKVRDKEIRTRAGRARLDPSPVPYWRELDSGGLHIGYRCGERDGKWVGRKYVGKRTGRAPYEWITLPGCADDIAPADGARVLDYDQATAAIRAWAAPASPIGPLTVRQAIADYVEWAKAHRKTGKDAEQRLALHVLPKVGDKAIADLTTKDIEQVQRGMIRKDEDDPDAERRSKDSSNRVMNYFRAALNRAYEDETNRIPSSAAWDRVKSFAGTSKAREVILEPQQVQRFLKTTKGTALGNLAKAALLIGARPPHELAGLRVKHFDRRHGTLDIVDGKTGKRTVTLTQEAIAFFISLAKDKSADDLLLPNDSGTAWTKSQHSRPFAEAAKKAKLPEDATIYCLRHTHISDAIINKMPLTILAENTGTSVAMISRNYAKAIAKTRQHVIEQHSYKLSQPKNARRAPAQ